MTTPPGFKQLVVQALEQTSFSHSITVGDYILGSGDRSADTARYDNFLATARPLTDGRTTHWIVRQPRPRLTIWSTTSSTTRSSGVKRHPRATTASTTGAFSA